MKRNLFRVTLVLFLTLSLGIGSVSTVSAARLVDNWNNHLDINDLVSTEGPHFNLDCLDMANEDETSINDHHFGDDITTTINWRTGVASFSNIEVNLTVTFPASEAVKTGTGREAGYHYGGPADVVGTILFESVTYHFNTTTAVYVAENHDLYEPPASMWTQGASYDFGNDPYSFIVNDIRWQNFTPYCFKIRASSQADTDVAFTEEYFPPKGPDSKYPQDYDIECSFAASTFGQEEPVLLELVAYDRKGNVTNVCYIGFYLWGLYEIDD